MPIAYTEQERVTASSAPNRSFDRTTNNNDENTTTVDDASRRRRPPPPRPGGRWSKLDGDSEGGRDGGRYGGGGYRDRGSRGGRTPRRNVRGYHGDMRRDARLERELFDDLNSDERPKTTGVNFDTYDDIPVEVSGRDVPPSIDAYTPETVGMDLTRNARLCGYVRPTPIQRHSIPIGTAGRDMLACAQTGSGKTAGFLFPIISSMISTGGKKLFPPRDSTARSRHSRSMVYPEALVLAPTRELAHQIDKEARKFTYGTGIATAVVYGGYEVRVEQLRRLFERGGCDLLVATPGRLLDLIGRERISLENVRHLVLDEADRMLDMGFEPQIRSIVEFSDMPSGENRQTMMFSATFPESIQRLASDFLRDYVFVTVGRVGSASRDVSQTVQYVDERDKVNALMGYLLTIEGDGLILVFVETKRTCDYVEDVLRDKGFPACSVHGDKTQAEREEALASFKDGGTPVMVATDVASRGLDVPNVTHVINVDFPRTIDSYVHRIGRTGRAGNAGDAVSFVNDGNDVAVMRELCHKLRESDQDVPEWLDVMCVRRRDEQPRHRPARAKKPEYRDYRTAFTGETTRSGTTSPPSFVEEVAIGGTVVGEGWDARARVDETKKSNVQTKTEKKTPSSPMPISPDAIDLALPGEDETAAAARIARRRRDAEVRAAAEKARAEEEAVAREAAERRRVDDAARASEVEEEILEVFSDGGMRGDDLARWSTSQGVLLPSVDKLVARILTKDGGEHPDPECGWAEKSEFGAALLAIIGDDITIQVEVLWGIQRYCHELRYPKVDGENLVQAMFRGAYKYDLVDADGFASWREDESHEHELGKTDAIIQTVDWFAWLEEDDDEEEDESSDEEKEEDYCDGDNDEIDEDEDSSAKENKRASDGGHTWFEMCE